ncbi:hypothetical protein E2C01_023064 [Portunus trituberculatus]|uniref:Uncharacterized protein n=1 Tax=Portunus trituberculatus TaxID=210409 RepID=A0A5B7E722_PORTR|nr:hypothetical protein [Portunus trituberculatus]
MLDPLISGVTADISTPPSPCLSTVLSLFRHPAGLYFSQWAVRAEECTIRCQGSDDDLYRRRHQGSNWSSRSCLMSLAVANHATMHPPCMCTFPLRFLLRLPLIRHRSSLRSSRCLACTSPDGSAGCPHSMGIGNIRQLKQTRENEEVRAALSLRFGDSTGAQMGTELSCVVGMGSAVSGGLFLVVASGFANGKWRISNEPCNVSSGGDCTNLHDLLHGAGIFLRDSNELSEFIQLC